MANREKYQGICFESSEGWKHMREYDSLPSYMRKLLRESPYNICPACLNMCGGGYYAYLKLTGLIKRNEVSGN